MLNNFGFTVRGKSKYINSNKSEPIEMDVDLTI